MVHLGACVQPPGSGKNNQRCPSWVRQPSAFFRSDEYAWLSISLLLRDRTLPDGIDLLDSFTRPSAYMIPFTRPCWNPD